MKLADRTVTGFVDLVSSSEPAPGGGSVAALEGALGAALAAMVCALTVGRKKYAEFDALAGAAQKRADDLKKQFVGIIDRDSQAFNAVSAVFSMPKDTDEQKQVRQSAMQSALKGCTETPFEMMELSLEMLELVQSLIGKTNASASSDLGVAALSLKAAVQGAWLNVLINLGGIKDEAFVDEYRQGGEQILEKALPLADDIYSAILNGL